MADDNKAQEAPMPTHMQAVYITFTDGRVAIFTGPAIVEPGEVVGIKSVAFGLPKPLPPECKWEKTG